MIAMIIFIDITCRDICVLEKEEKESGRSWSSAVWNVGKMMMVMGMVVGGIMLWKRHN